MKFYLLGIILSAIAFGLFVVCLHRLFKIRYTHKVFVHSFQQLLVIYVIVYIEIMIGIAFACFICPYRIYLTPSAWVITFYVLLVFSSSACAIRLLRIYRIYLSNLIEQGGFKYEILIKRKLRLTRLWNFSILCGYLVIVVIIFTVFVLIHEELSDSKIYDYILLLFFAIRIFEISFEILFSFIFFRKKTIKNIYKVESAILIAGQLVVMPFLISNTPISYFKYGILAITKTFCLLFFDLFITRILIKENEKRPLLPPIYLINSSIFVIEIELVYQCFDLFIETSHNSHWKSLLDSLMEIQIRKMQKKLNPSFLNKVDSILTHSFLLEPNADFTTRTLNLEIEIIKQLDQEAFPKFMSSIYYLALDEKLKVFNSNIIHFH